jgi:hypothetical protein
MEAILTIPLKNAKAVPRHVQPVLHQVYAQHACKDLTLMGPPASPSVGMELLWAVKAVIQGLSHKLDV